MKSFGSKTSQCVPKQDPLVAAVALRSLLHKKHTVQVQYFAQVETIDEKAHHYGMGE